MIPLAGGPSVVPALVPAQRLATANAMETLSWTLSGVVGPAVAGALIPLVGPPNVLVLDALSFAAFALGLSRVPSMPARVTPATSSSHGFGEPVRLLLRTDVLLSTTLMFMTFNIGQGLLFVWLPVLVGDVLGAGPALYGALLGILAAGEVIGSLVAGGIRPSLPLGSLIAASQALSGLAIGLVLLRVDVWSSAVGLFGLGLFSAPLTIWAQTLRMQLIPGELRGRTFALLRTLMQGTVPLGGALAGVLLPLVGVPAAIAGTAALIGLPGPLGALVPGLRRAGPPAGIVGEVAHPAAG